MKRTEIVFAVWLLAVFYCWTFVAYSFVFMGHEDGIPSSVMAYLPSACSILYCLLLPLGLRLFRSSRRFCLIFSILRTIQLCGIILYGAAIFFADDFAYAVISVFVCILLPCLRLPFSRPSSILIVLGIYMLTITWLGWSSCRRRTTPPAHSRSHNSAAHP